MAPPHKPGTPPGDYRIFIGAFPTGEWADRIQIVRETHDAKTAAITRPHVTLAGLYWRQGPATPANEADLIAGLSGLSQRVAPFDMVLGGIATFGSKVVYLDVVNAADLAPIRHAILAIAGPDNRGFTAHLTLAMRLPREQIDATAEQLRQSDWHHERHAVPIRELCLMQRGPDDPMWRTIARIPLHGPTP